MNVLVNALLINSSLTFAGGMSGGGFVASNWVELNLRNCTTTCETELVDESKVKQDLIYLGDLIDAEGNQLIILQDPASKSIYINMVEPENK
ncbi:MAG: hypothetical protein ACOH5I_06990 [Oligoflexus sp.]